MVCKELNLQSKCAERTELCNSSILGHSHPQSSEKGNRVGLFIDSVPIATAQMLAWNKNKLLDQVISSMHLGEYNLTEVYGSLIYKEI